MSSRRQLIRAVGNFLGEGVPLGQIAMYMGWPVSELEEFIEDHFFLSNNDLRGAGNQAGHERFGTPIAEDVENNPFLLNTDNTMVAAIDAPMDLDTEGPRTSLHHGSSAPPYVGPKKKTVHVSKDLKKKVEKVLHKDDQITGHYYRSEHGDFLVAPLSNTQYVTDNFGIIAHGPNNGASSSNNLMAWNFAPEYFMHAAAVLFNNKVDTGDMAVDSAGSFANLFGLTFDVLYSKVEYNLKNLSGRTVHLKIYNCVPKKVGVYKKDYTMVNAAQPVSLTLDGNVRYAKITGTLAAPVEGQVTWDTTPVGTAGTSISTQMAPPSIAWQRALDQGNIDGDYRGGTSVAEIHQTPVHPGFKALYKTTCTEVVLLPGQAYSYVSHGPRNLTFEFNKHLINQVFMNVQKYMSCPMVVWKMDEVRGLLGPLLGVGPAFDGALNPVISVTRHKSCTIAMPEQVGFQFPAGAYPASAYQQLNVRRKRNFFQTYFGNTPSTVFDSAQPINSVTRA